MNHVAKYRAKAKLSQRALATMVGVSQQTIQRIEAEAVTVRFETAAKLATALSAPLQALFPETRVPPGAPAAQRHTPPIDLSHCSHTLVMRFTDELEKAYLVDEATATRVRNALFSPAPLFLRFGTASHEVVINTGELLWTNLQFDPGHLPDPTADLDAPLTLHFIGSRTPSEFRVEPDEGSMSEEDEEGVELQQVLFMLEGAIGPSENEVLHFRDEDGEEVIFNTGRLKVFEVPRHAVNPRLLASVYEGMEEDEVFDATVGNA